MKDEELSGHILYVSGQNNTKHARTGSRTIVDILLAADLLTEKEGVLFIAAPTESTDQLSNPNDVSIPNKPTTEAPESKLPSVNPPTYSQLPSIAINIQLHLPETENADVYEKLFKALREQLISPKSSKPWMLKDVYTELDKLSIKPIRF